MAYFPTKKQVKTEITDHSHRPIQAIHQTTSDFFHFKIARIIPIAPDQHYKFKYGSKGILMPMPNPTIGVINSFNRWFFVPFKTINPRWNDFEENNMHINSDITEFMPNTAPTISIDRINMCIRNAATTTGASNTHYDFAVVNNGTTTYYLHSRTSKNRTTLLRQLGYKLNMDISSTETVSLMPILAAARVYIDWYYNGNYKNNSDYNTIAKLLKYDGSNQGPNITAATLGTILDSIMYTFYDSSWDVDTWDNPESPAIQMTNLMMVQDNSYSDAYVTAPNNGKNVYFDVGNTVSGQGSGAFTQYNANTLEQLTAYIKRNQLAGNDTAKRFLARYGKELKDELDSRSRKISEQQLSTEIWSVQSNSDTAPSGGTNLGSFAGNGEINGEPGYLDFYSGIYHGYLIEVNTVQPRVFVDEGANPIIFDKTRFDFLQHTFDGIGSVPVLKQMIYTSMDQTKAAAQTTQRDVFGFLPRGWHYKVLQDHISGDYEYPTKQAFYDSFTLQRKLTFQGTADIVHDFNYVLAKQDWTQFQRIFYSQENEKTQSPEDKINFIHWLEGDVYDSYKNLYDDYDFDENHHNDTVEL